MSIPLVYFLYAYYIFLAVWAILFLVGLYHMLKYGFKNALTMTVTFIFCVVALAMLLASFYFIGSVDNWDDKIRLGPAWNNETLEY